MIGPSAMQSRNGSRYSHRQMALVMAIGIVLALDEPHVGMRCCRRLFAKIVADRLSLSRAVNNKSSPTDIPGGRVSHRECEGCGDGGIHRISTLVQYLSADSRGEVALRNDHSPRAGNRR